MRSACGLTKVNWNVWASASHTMPSMAFTIASERSPAFLRSSAARWTVATCSLILASASAMVRAAYHWRPAMIASTSVNPNQRAIGV